MLKNMLPLVLAMAFCLNVKADEAAVRKTMEGKLGTKVDSVVKSGYLGLYEVYANGEVVYTDEKGTAIIAGPLIDGNTMKNITAERMKSLTAIKFSDLPFDNAFKQVLGDGKRVVATFLDPNCAYCKRLVKDLQSLKNVTIYTFLLPILSQDSVNKSNQIWCSADKNREWTAWMIDGKTPSSAGNCNTAAVTKNQEFARKLMITGTPTLFFGDGERVPGYIPLSQIEQKLNQVK